MEEMNINANCSDIVGFTFHFARMMKLYEELYEGKLHTLAKVVRKLVWDISDTEHSAKTQAFKVESTLNSLRYKPPVPGKQGRIKTWFQFNWFGRSTSTKKHFMEIYRVSLTDHTFMEVFVHDTTGSNGDKDLADSCILTATQARDKLIDFTSHMSSAVYADPSGNRVSYGSMATAFTLMISYLSEHARFNVLERGQNLCLYMVPLDSDYAMVRINLMNPIHWDSTARWQ